MKILACSLTYPLPNGVTTSLDMSVDGFLSAGHQIRIVAPEYKAGKARPEHYPVPFSVLTRAFLSFFGKDERTFGLRAKSYIDKIAKDFQPHAYWLHTLTPFPSAFEKYMMASGKPKVLTYHTFVEKYGALYGGAIGSRVMLNRSKAVANRVDAVIAPSESIAEKLRGYGVRTPLTVIYTGIEVPQKLYTKKELAAKYGFSPTATLLLFVGRVSKEKNIEVLMAAAKQLRGNMKNLVFVVVGPGDIAEMKEKAKKMGISNNVIFTGPLIRENAQKCYGAADVFVFASQTEVQGLVISEAMMAGIPVVALASQIQEEIYPEGVAVVVRDKLKFAEAVSSILDNPAGKKQLVEAAKKFVSDKFSKSRMIKRQIALFESLVKI